MRHLVTVIALAASAAVFAVSAYMNWSYGLTKATDAFDRNVWGGFSVALDCLKALLPIFIASQLKRKHRALLAVSVIIFIAAIIYSLFSSLGFSSTTKTAAVDQRKTAAVASKTVNQRLARLRQSLQTIGDTTPIVTITQNIVSAKRHRRWQATKHCTDDTTPKSIDYCNAYRVLLSQQNAAQMAKKLNNQIDQLEKKLISRTDHKQVSDPDPQASLIARLTKTDRATINDALSILIAVLLEITSAFGFFIALDYYRSSKPAETAELVTTIAKPKVQAKAVAGSSPALLAAPDPNEHLHQYMQTAIVQSKDARLKAKPVYEHYCAWCETNNLEPVSMKVFGIYIRDHTNIRKIRTGGYISYAGIELAPNP